MVELNLLVEIEDLNIHNFVSLNKKIISAPADPSLYTSDSKEVHKFKKSKVAHKETINEPEVTVEEYDTEADIHKQLGNDKVNFHRVLFADYESFVADLVGNNITGS